MLTNIKKHPDPVLGFDSRAKNLIELMLNENPELRPTIEEVLQHPFFDIK